MHGDSQCKQLPYSQVTECQCVMNFDGEKCQHHSTNSFSSTISLLVSSTLQIPTLSDIYFNVKDLQKQINEDLTQVSTVVRSLKTSLQVSYKRISNELGENFQWTNLKIDYSKTIQDLLYYIKEFNKIGNSEKRRGELATHLTKPGMIRKWASDLNTLFVGSQHIVQDQKPLMIIYMDRYHQDACSSAYKKRIDNVYKQFVILQTDTYFIWSEALNILSQGSIEIAELYQKRVLSQVSKLVLENKEIVPFLRYKAGKSEITICRY